MEPIAIEKRRVEIVDDYGEHLATVSVPAESKDFEGAVLEGFCAPGVKTLRGKSFRGAELYWAMLQASDLSECNFEDADLRGANLKETVLVGANLRNANLGRDNLGGSTQMHGADLTGAVLHQANLVGVKYDGRTKFPERFSPEHAGMIEET